MSRRFVAILISSALVFGNVSTSAWSASSSSSTVRTEAVQTVAPATNKSPLAPGAAAGIKEAQGYNQIEPWAAIAIVAGIFLVGVLLIGDNDDDDHTTSTSTTGTN